MLENALQLIGNRDRPFLVVEFDLKTGDTAFDGSRLLLHPLVDQQKVPALPRRKQRSAEYAPVDFAFDSNLTTQPPHLGCIERYVDNDPVETGTQTLQSGLETLDGGCSFDFRRFRHGRKASVCILI